MSKRAASGESSIYRGNDGRWHGYVPMGLKRDGERDRRHVSGQGCPWRDLPERFGPWQIGKRHARFSKDGPWDQIMAALLVTADQAGHVDWQLSIDSTVCRVHRHGLNMTREVAAVLPSHTGGPLELQETTR